MLGGRACRGRPPFVEAGFTHVALVQVGGDAQPAFLDVGRHTLLPALREEFGEATDPVIRVRRR